MVDVLVYECVNFGKMSFVFLGNGFSDYIMVELFWQLIGIFGLYIFYKGGGLVMIDLLGNQVDVSFMNINIVLLQIKVGKLCVLSIMSVKCLLVLFDVFMMDEFGIKGLQVYFWQVVVVLKGLFVDIKVRLYDGIVIVLNVLDVKFRLFEQGFEVVVNIFEQFIVFQVVEFVCWKVVIYDCKISVD